MTDRDALIEAVTREVIARSKIDALVPPIGMKMLLIKLGVEPSSSEPPGERDVEGVGARPEGVVDQLRAVLGILGAEIEEVVVGPPDL